MLPWLKSWCESNIRPIRHDGESKAKTLIQRIGDALPSASKKRGPGESRDYSGVWKALEGEVGINRAHWEQALRTLHAQHELSQLALEDFLERCNAAEEGRKPQTRRLVDCFAPVQARLVARLEAGKHPSKAVIRAFAEASGLVCAWVLCERWFLVEDLKGGLEAVASMGNRWAALVSDAFDDDVTHAADDETLSVAMDGELVGYDVRKARDEFFWRLATWLPRITKWDSGGEALSLEEQRRMFQPIVCRLPEDILDVLLDPRRPRPSIFAKNETEGSK